ncbi:hypothetical protein BOX15_Mlig017802g1 [Macrostomum lignano]|uniref:Uncharacterized protein n=1 Tax=Macrostomum lignano TaxID=282301 RepID=A0A267EV08_9PLAT|nr:hypothetical protein BOX15_Mlig017802g3 [Macrostomum lignano]PAA49885.1 hypothetical protein BOX15_Mlig017802g2 [Macrostomum lignano]PAA65286.1 hypothetical protein BOX15_Mlig017802g1 [Macrostomum lignano]
MRATRFESLIYPSVLEMQPAFRRETLPVLLVLLTQLSLPALAFYPDADDVNMDFMKKDPKAGPEIDRMMLMNTEDPKLRAEAEEAFQEIMRAKRLSKLQVCRRECVSEHELAEEFARCNSACEAAHKPGEYDELPTLQGTDEAAKKAAKQPDSEDAAEKKEL